MERRAQLAHLKGAVAWKQGDWNTAVMYFCEAEDLAALVSDPSVRNYTDFALASSYLMQGEQTAAERMAFISKELFHSRQKNMLMLRHRLKRRWNYPAPIWMQKSIMN